MRTKPLDIPTSTHVQSGAPCVLRFWEARGRHSNVVTNSL